MATTYYIPDKTGWAQSSQTPIRLRIKVSQVYNGSEANTSTLTFTLQGYSSSYGGKYYLLDNANISINGLTLYAGGGSGSSTGWYIPLSPKSDMSSDSSWFDLTHSWSKTLSHQANGSLMLLASISYAKLFCNDNGYYSVFQNKTTPSPGVSVGVARTFTLTVSKDAHSIVTIKKGGSTFTGSTVTYGDVLQIYFNADTGYSVSTHTVNGTTFTSGGSHTVAGAVSVVVSSVQSVNPDSGIRIENGVSWENYIMKIDNGATWDTYVPFVDTGTGWVKY